MTESFMASQLSILNDVCENVNEAMGLVPEDKEGDKLCENMELVHEAMKALQNRIWEYERIGKTYKTLNTGGVIEHEMGEGTEVICVGLSSLPDCMEYHGKGMSQTIRHEDLELVNN